MSKSFTQNAINMSTNLTNYYTRYHGLIVGVNRNLNSRLLLFASYTWQRQTQIGEWREDEANRYLHPAAWFDNSRLARPHLWKASASYTLPYGITTAAIFTWTDGQFGGALTRVLTAPDPAFGPATLVLSNGRSVPNPLATVTRFVGPRSDGQLQVPGIPRLNIRVGKVFKLTERQTLEANSDFVNLTNDGTPLFFQNGTNTSLTTFGQFSSTTQSPRGAQISLRYRF